jgi:hypothetical protein
MNPIRLTTLIAAAGLIHNTNFGAQTIVQSQAKELPITMSSIKISATNTIIRYENKQVIVYVQRMPSYRFIYYGIYKKDNAVCSNIAYWLGGLQYAIEPHYCRRLYDIYEYCYKQIHNRQLVILPARYVTTKNQRNKRRTKPQFIS